MIVLPASRTGTATLYPPALFSRGVAEITFSVSSNEQFEKNPDQGHGLIGGVEKAFLGAGELVQHRIKGGVTKIWVV